MYKAANADVRTEVVAAPFITAVVWEVAGDTVAVVADVREVLSRPGPACHYSATMPVIFTNIRPL